MENFTCYGCEYLPPILENRFDESYLKQVTLSSNKFTREKLYDVINDKKILENYDLDRLFDNITFPCKESEYVD